MSDAERTRDLLTAVLDGEAGEEEVRELEERMRDDPELERELREMQRIKEVTMNVRLKQPPVELWSSYWEGVYRRLERGLGWLLVSTGAAVLLISGVITGLRAVLADTELAWWLKGAILAIAAGALVLLISVIREKLFLHRSERYKDVQR